MLLGEQYKQEQGGGVRGAIAGEHERGTAAVDEAAADRGAESDGDRAGRRDDAGIRIAAAAAADEQHLRQGSHADRRTGEQAPRDERANGWVGKQMAIAAKPPGDSRTGHAVIMPAGALRGVTPVCNRRARHRAELVCLAPS